MSVGSVGHDTIDEDVIIDSKYVVDQFNLSSVAKKELEKILSTNFDIFRMQKETGENELITTVTYMLAKEDIFTVLDL